MWVCLETSQCTHRQVGVLRDVGQVGKMQDRVDSTIVLAASVAMQIKQHCDHL